MSKYVTPNKYAKLCGISHQAIYDRIKRGTIKVIEIPGPDGLTKSYVDTEKYPPTNLKKNDK